MNVNNIHLTIYDKRILFRNVVHCCLKTVVELAQTEGLEHNKDDGFALKARRSDS